MKNIKIVVASLLLAVSATVGLATFTAAPALAVSPEQSACQGSGGTWADGACNQGSRTLLGTVRSVGNILIFLTGAIAVLMIIIGGIRYALSGGDQGAINSAKNTIFYAVVGVIVAFTAYAIVNFVTDSL